MTDDLEKQARECLASVVEDARLSTSAIDARDIQNGVQNVRLCSSTAVRAMLAFRTAQPGEEERARVLSAALASEERPKIGEGAYEYAKPEHLPQMLREQAQAAIFFECEPHVIVDAWNIVQMAADELEARLATPPQGKPDREAVARKWADDADPIRDLAVKLAARATALEELEGEWSWYEIAKLAIALPTDDRYREREAKFLNDIAVMMSEFVDNWPHPKKMKTALALVAKTIRASLEQQKHKFWGAGEFDCPSDIKAPNGELHTLRCKVCGTDNPRDDRCGLLSRTALESHMPDKGEE